ncbi:MAG: hypothetical protein Q9226_007111 [Calogaya cf. arnoldii]
MVFLPMVNENTDFLPLLYIRDREAMLERLRSGAIDEAQFTAEVQDLALARLTRAMRIYAPDISISHPNDLDEHQDNYLKFSTAVSSKDSEYVKVFLRAENVRPLVDQIFDDWSRLQAITRIHGEALARRWTKRIVPKRKKVLLEAWPDMNPAHRPDFDVSRRDQKGPACRDAVMMPYINLQDLSFERNLLEFMNSRAQTSPERFAFSDGLPFNTAVAMEALRPAAKYDVLMLLTGQKSRDTYGKLKKIDVAERRNIVFTGYAFRLAQGVAILETQQRLYRFLLLCAELLLHDTDLAQSVSNFDTADQEEHSSLTNTMTSEPAEWQSVSKMNSRASFRLPQPFSVDHLLKLAGAKRDAAEDVFWTLHEDPEFF